MKHNYTSNFLIKYIYGECGLLRRLEIENQISEDRSVRREYLRLKRAFRMLPKLSFNPSDKAIKAILDYNRNAHLNPSC